MKNMNHGNNKEGVTVKEIEEFTKKHRLEVVLCLSFILALFFSFLFFGAGWGIFFGGIGAGVGAIFPRHVEFTTKRIFQFVLKQEQITQIVLAVVTLIVSIFLPFVIYLFVGLNGGRSLIQLSGEMPPK